MKSILLALVLSFAPVLHAEPSTEAASEGTWQLQYASALKLLQQADAPTKKLIGNYDTVPIDDKTQAVLKRFAPAMQCVRDSTHADLHQATPKTQNIQPVIDQLSGARTLFDLAMLQVRAELANRDQASAANDLIATIALGRNIAREPLIISNLVGTAVETRAMEDLAKQLPSLPPEVLADVRKQYESLPEPIKFSEIIRGEQALAPQLLTKQMGAAAPAEIKKLTPFYDAAAKAADDTPGKFADLVQKAANNSPSVLARVLAPSLIRPFQAFQRLAVERAMFAAALDVVEHGQQSLMKTSDPAGEGPFKYRALAKGFALSSELKDSDNKAVTLVVGE